MRRRVGRCEDAACHQEAVVVVVQQADPHSRVVDKNWEGFRGSSEPSPRPHRTAQGSSAGKINPYNSGCKDQWGLGQWKKLPDFQVTPLKGTTWS